MDLSFHLVLLTLAHIGPKTAHSGVKSGFESLTRLYLDRIQPHIPVQSEAFAQETAFWTWLARQHKRAPAIAVLLDSRGRQLSSSEIAAWLGGRRDQGAQHVVFAIGPADGWSGEACAQAGLLLSFGAITMPHELARLVLAEQVYRACTILAGHPYHCGH